MSELRSVCVVSPMCPLRERVAESLGPDLHTFDSAEELLASEPSPPVIVLLLAGRTPADDVLRVVRRLGGGEGEWTTCLVLEGEGGVEVRTLSVGWREELEDVRAFAEGDDDRLLELRRSVERLSRARHDINNPLTSALAETQLLLMDVEDERLRAPLLTVQEQLRRIRDLVAETRGLRAGDD